LPGAYVNHRDGEVCVIIECIVEMWMFMTSPHREGQDYTPPHQRTHHGDGALGGIRAPQDHLALFIRTIGIAGARVKIGLANLVYNLKRLLFLRTAAA
jgi:transposase, IS5 family